MTEVLGPEGADNSRSMIDRSFDASPRTSGDGEL